jgi:hypothetical protein
VTAGSASATPLERPPCELREAVRRSLVAVPGYSKIEAEDQRAIAHSLVRIAYAARLLEDEAATAGAHTQARTTPLSRAMNAGDELGGNAVDRMAGTTRNMIRAISFPRFVNELITGVFRAMVETNQQQLQQYVELVRGVSQSLDGFAALGGGNDDMAKRWLADQFPQNFAIEAPDLDDRPDPDEEPEPLRLISRGAAPSPDALRAALSLEPGQQVPTSSGPELIVFVRRSLAQNRQQMLATMVQMGMQRIVVDSGRISAGMRFHIDASSAAAEQRHSGFDTRTTIGASGSVGFGWWSASASVNSTIGYVQTTDVQTREDVSASADLTSSVELHFRTDQVPLDRIASQQTVQRLQLNTLNPERELAIAAETDRARIAANQAVETARAARPATPLAPNPAVAPPAAPTLDPAAIATRAGKSETNAAKQTAKPGDAAAGGGAAKPVPAEGAKSGAGASPDAAAAAEKTTLGAGATTVAGAGNPTGTTVGGTGTATPVRMGSASNVSAASQVGAGAR